MRKLGFVSAFLVLALGTLAAACGDDDGDDGGPGGGSAATFSCTTSGGNGCIEYRGAQQPIDAMRDACTEGDGTPGTQCSRSGAQGGCTMGSGQAFVRNIYYEMEAEELDTVKQICASSQGVWLDSP
ncbi:MAG TPA: hypothetical protein VI072_11895 [Polyangiaceae bacterium]